MVWNSITRQWGQKHQKVMSGYWGVASAATAQLQLEQFYAGTSTAACFRATFSTRAP
jgi:hypothetical protein